MTVLALLAFLILIGALTGVWRARDRGPRETRMSLLVLIVAIVPIGLAWFVVRGR
jgi:magnesium-transporting ATPase (P-type)